MAKSGKKSEVEKLIKICAIIARLLWKPKLKRKHIIDARSAGTKFIGTRTKK